MTTTFAIEDIIDSEQTQFSNCLQKLLQALNWKGSARELKEAVPYLDPIASITMLNQVMENLDYEVSSFNTALKNVDERLFPCVFIDKKGQVSVLLEKRNNQIICFDGVLNTERTLSLDDEATLMLSGKITVFHKQQTKDHIVEKHWLYQLLLENKVTIIFALMTSFVINIFMLATPLFIMSVYNRVVATSSYSMLVEFVIGVMIAMAGFTILYRIRSIALAWLGANLDRRIGQKIFNRLLFLAPAYTETATVGSQVARIRDFDRVREFLSGPMLVVLFDVPFIFIALALIVVFGGLLGFVPVGLIALYVLLTLVLKSVTNRLIINASKSASARQEFLLETVQKIRAVKYSGGEKSWLKRYRLLSADAAHANIYSSLVAAINSAISEMLMIISGLIVICIGAVMVINQTLSVGALIAILILIWRILAPIKTLFNIFPRLVQTVNSLKQINRLFSIEPEVSKQDTRRLMRFDFHGRVQFSRVSFRYKSTFDPALMGVNFSVEPGQCVGIVGRNGAGKSTLLKLVLGLYQPQGGGILIDGKDIRQLNPLALRASISYVPQTPSLFYGSIATNIRLVKPGATDEEIIQAAKMAGVYQEIQKLPEGFNTHITDFSAEKYSRSFQKCLALAKAYVKNPKILLLDEPADNLDDEEDQLFMNNLQKFKGDKTVILVSHRPSHLALTDKIIVFDRGQLLAEGSPERLLEQVKKGLL